MIIWFDDKKQRKDVVKGVNFVPYRPVRQEFIVPIGELVQKHPWFVPLKIPVFTGLYWMYCRISDILAEKWKSGGTKSLKKMEKVSSRKLTTPSSLVVFPYCRPFPPAFLLLFYPTTSLSSSSSSSSILIETEPLFLFLLF